MPPSIVFIRVHSICNARCAMCDYWRMKPLILPPERLRTLIEEFHTMGVREIRFSGGEPLLYKNLLSIVEKAKKLNLVVSIITNGFLLPDFADRIRQLAVDEIIVSIDSADPYQHNEIRNKAALWQRAISGLKRLNSKVDRPFITINVVVSKQNYKDIQDILYLRHEIVFDRINLIPVKGKEHLSLGKVEIEYLQRQFNNLRTLAQSLDIEFPSSAWIKIVRQMTFGDISGHTCNIPSVMTLVNFDGCVYPCNSSVGDKEKESLCYGNVLTQDFESVWYSRRALKVRDRISSIGCPAYYRCDPINILKENNLFWPL